MEELIEWNEKYSVNNEIIDSQHKELLNILNIVKVSINNQVEAKAMDLVTQKLLEYTIFHFDEEMNRLREKNFPEIEAHQKEHDYFIREVSNFKDKFDKNSPTLSEEIINFLTKWFKHHIQEEDKKYASWI